MNLVFCLYEYFPYGGLQRDFLKIACSAMDRGHTVRVLTMDWQGDKPAGLDVQLLPHSAISNHRRCLKFNRAVEKLFLQLNADIIIGFNKMSGLDLYFAADSCYRARKACSRFTSRLMPRYRTYVDFERAVFAPESKTEILLLAPQEKSKFIACYGTQEERFHLLPPGVSRDHFRPANALKIRDELRKELGLLSENIMLLMVGSAFQTKGVDRTLRAMARLPEKLRARVKLYVIGKGKIGSFRGIAKKMGLAKQVYFLGGRDDIPRYMLAADLLLHPARTEAAGNALIEAMAAGLPVLVTENCGYAFHVKDANAGRLIPMPFEQAALDQALLDMLNGSELQTLGENGAQYAARADMSGLHEHAVDIIEEIAARKALR